MKASAKTNTKPAQVPDFAPGDIAQETQRTHFDRGARVTVERNRWFLISMLLGAVLLVNAVAWNTLLPLKTIETFQVDKVAGGRLITDGTPVGNWAPDSDSIAYFINKWAASTFDVNRATIEGTLTESAEQVIGTAKAQLQEFRKRDNPLVSLRDTPAYSRSYEYVSLNFIKDDVVLLRFRTHTRLSPESTPTVTVYAMTVTFTRIKPTTRAEVMKNPAGLYITNFNLTEESVSK